MRNFLNVFHNPTLVSKTFFDNDKNDAVVVEKCTNKT